MKWLCWLFDITIGNLFGRWMCSCGYEGRRFFGIRNCPKCHGNGECTWNG
ncbi:MAG: hypothetical protein J6B91_09440 [Prevotella sp.]|nr:hypothetical protein [Prevotella sp.]